MLETVSLFLAWKAAKQIMQGLVFVVDSNDSELIPEAFN